MTELEVGIVSSLKTHHEAQRCEEFFSGKRLFVLPGVNEENLSTALGEPLSGSHVQVGGFDEQDIAFGQGNRSADGHGLIFA